MRINSFCSFVYLLGTISVASATSGPATPAGKLEISYELKDGTISLHEPVVLLFKVHNGLEQPVALEMGVNWIEFFEFSLTSPQGKVIQGRGQRSDGLTRQPGKLTIQPGEDHQQKLLLNQWFDFHLPGRYVLRAWLSTAIDVGKESTPPPQASYLALEIKPRNTDRLAKVCSQLAKEVATANGGEAEEEPLLELSYVNDPIAVPYLAEFLSQHRINYSLAISGLERIGNEAAVEVLLSTLGDNYADVADLARQALTRMQDRIPDSNLKETVKRELALRRG